MRLFKQIIVCGSCFFFCVLLVNIYFFSTKFVFLSFFLGFFDKTARRVVLAGSALFAYDSLCFFAFAFMCMITCGSCFFSTSYLFCIYFFGAKFVFFVFLVC